MIRKILHVAALTATLALAGCFGDSTPQEKIAVIEEIQTKNIPLDEQQQAGLADLVTKGKAALVAGNDEAANEAFQGALDILKAAQDAAIFNKSE